MASREIERTIRPSLLDRLVETDPHASGDAVVTMSESVRRLKQSVLRDLEWLLNTRRIAEPAGKEYHEVRHSVYHFGLPDITSLSGDSEVVQRQLVREIEQCIQQFEPRLANVRVSLGQPDPENRRRIRFVIEGLLRMEPDPEHVVFDTVLETGRGEFQITGDTHA